LLTVREVAERLRVCTATVYRLCESGRLWHLRVSNAVRVPEMALQAFMEGAAGGG
jgi:excisionase family DNA binding protein